MYMGISGSDQAFRRRVLDVDGNKHRVSSRDPGCLGPIPLVL